MASSHQNEKQSQGHSKLFVLVLGALGVVFGDIGTSPLYAVNEMFFGHGEIPVTPENIYGSISLVIWAITIVVCFKYLTFVLRADNDGEGGVFALYGLLNKLKKHSIKILMLILMLSAGLLFGDGIITPAISVLSAVEGLRVAAPALGNYVVPITVVILTGLFAIQFKGTAKVGTIFGPVVMVWFICLALLGISQIIDHPQIFYAFNPLYGLQFLHTLGWQGSLLLLGAVMLVITGGEALYADMGHFGKKPIRIGWFSMVYPALMLNYLGQGAYLLSGKMVHDNNIFFSMVPDWALIPTIILATMATIIASQALISGVFSLTSQAIALGVFPRLRIKYTHKEHVGQIYLGFINWALYLGCVVLVIGFGSSTRLASAYGLAVAADMLVTSSAMFAVSQLIWKWPFYKSTLLFGFFALIDLSFLTANSLKFLEGGYVPLSIGIVLFTVMYTWRWGRKATFKAYSDQHTMTVGELIDTRKKLPFLMDRTIIFMVPKTLSATDNNTPALIQYFYDRYGTFPRNMLFVSVFTLKVPYIHNEQDRYEIMTFQSGNGSGSVASVSMNFGFMEEPNVEQVLEKLMHHHQLALPDDPKHWSILASQERLVQKRGRNIIKYLRYGLFQFLRHNSSPFYYYYGLGQNMNINVDIVPVKIS